MHKCSFHRRGRADVRACKGPRYHTHHDLSPVRRSAFQNVAQPETDVNLHSPSLAKYHKRLLTLRGDATGAWDESRVGTEEQSMGIEREIASLESRLAEVPAWESRIKEIAAQLGVGIKLPNTTS